MKQVHLQAGKKGSWRRKAVAKQARRVPEEEETAEGKKNKGTKAP